MEREKAERYSVGFWQDAQLILKEFNQADFIDNEPCLRDAAESLLRALNEAKRIAA
jgi:hypothetical protein